MIWPILTITVLLMLSACFSAAETAIFSVNLINVRTRVRQGDRIAKVIERLREDPQTTLGAILIGNNIVNITAASLVTLMTIRAFGDASIGLATGIITVLIIIFGEFMPKTIAAHSNDKLSALFALPIFGLTRLLSPVLKGLNLATRRLVPNNSTATNVSVSEEEIKTMTQLAVKAGTVERGEREMIERVFLFNDITAFDVMTPREHMIRLDGNKTLNETLPLIRAAEYSRYPVFDGDKDKIIGIVHIKDVFAKIGSSNGTPAEVVRVRDLIEPPIFIPKTKLIDDLLREMQKSHIHLALVVNEFGSVVGLVTLEDLIEELVGEIADETDVEEHVIKRVDKNNIICHGEVAIKDLNRFFNTNIAAPERRSLSWVILKELGSIPTVGQVVPICAGLTATIEQMSDLRISKVRLTKSENGDGCEA